MKIFTTHQTKEIDRRTIELEPILSINLMERASIAMTQWLTTRFAPGVVTVFAGNGNNGGDALAVARMLAIGGWEVTVCMASHNNLSPECQINYTRLTHLTKVKLHLLANGDAIPQPDEGIVIDGLLGSGINRPAEGTVLDMIQAINRLSLPVVSIDLPSGLRGEDNSEVPRHAIVNATHTLSLGFPKLAFLFPENDHCVGEWHVLEFGLHRTTIEAMTTPWHLTRAMDTKAILPTRDKFAHKGHYGHALLMSGSYGMMGAAVLASKACLKAGVGLLTTHAPRYGYEILQTTVPEAMVSIDRSDILISEFPDLTPYDAIGIGPGIGLKTNTCEALAQLLDHITTQRLVMDADALNILSQHPALLDKLPRETVLTPHPKEFQRLAGNWNNDYERLERLRAFAIKHGIVVVLKGAYTTIATPEGTCYFNTTGNPGMASAGSGDVLTGIILGLLSQKIAPAQAAILGVYLHGSAGDIYANAESEESLTANDLVRHLGQAFRELKNN